MVNRPYTYKLTAPPENDAVTLETFKKHIKRTNTNEDLLLSKYLKASIKFCEALTRRDFITRTYITYRDFFPVACQNEGFYQNGVIPNYRNGFNSGPSSNVGFEIRRSPLQSVTQIQYYVSGVLTLLDSTTYYNTTEEDYSSILAVSDWPYDCDNRLQAIQITVVIGYGDNDTDVPEDISNAILELATALWVNRGDCSDSGCSKAIPSNAKRTLLQYRIENL